MLSAMSWSAEVMNRLTPSRCQVPSGCSTAFVRPAPTSDPASGSVSTMVEAHSLSIMMVAICCCTGVPSSCISLAVLGPELYIWIAGFEPRINSAAAQRSDGGAP